MGEGRGSTVKEGKWNGFDQSTFNICMEFVIEKE